MRNAAALLPQQKAELATGRRPGRETQRSLQVSFAQLYPTDRNGRTACVVKHRRVDISLLRQRLKNLQGLDRPTGLGIESSEKRHLARVGGGILDGLQLGDGFLEATRGSRRQSALQRSRCN